MKRSSFLRLFAATGALLTKGISVSATAAVAASSSVFTSASAEGSPETAGWMAACADRSQTAVAVLAGKDRYNKPLPIFDGDTFYTKIGNADTDGDLFAFESSRGKKGGPALHIHPDQDEWFYILSGEFLVKVGDQTFTAKAGDSVFAPRKVPHAFAKINDEKEEARMLITYQPAGKMESLFQAVSQGRLKTMSPEEQARFKADHGIVVVGPALTYLKQ